MIEYRTVSGDATASDGTLSGRVTPFNSQTTIGDLKRGGFREQIAPGAFAKTLQERDIVLLWNHNADFPLARTSAGNLALSEGRDGLNMTATPVDTSYGEDLMKLARAKVVKGMSFGFEVIKDDWSDQDGNPSDSTRGINRTIREVRLHEVSAVTFPAYTDTSISARDAINAAREGRADSPPKPYGDVEYADPKNGKYPIDTEEHAKAAWAYINVAKNADEYPLNGVTLSDVKAKIEAALKKFGVNVSEQNDATADLERRDDPNGDEIAAIKQAIHYINSGNTEAAIDVLTKCLEGDGGSPGDGDGDADDTGAESYDKKSETEPEDYEALRIKFAIRQAGLTAL